MTQEVETTVGPDVQADIVINPHAMTDHHAHSDTVILPYLGTVTVPGGIYTVVFGGLGILTIIEVLIAGPLDALNVMFIKVLVLMGLAVVKALLVVMFYMHLRQDNRVFRMILGLPLLIVVLGVLYLLSIPPGGGEGYLDAAQTPSAAELTGTATLGAEVTSEAAATAGQTLPIQATLEATTESTAEGVILATAEATSEATTEATSEATAEATADS